MKKTLFTLSMTLVIVLSSFWSVSAQVFTLDLSNPLNPAEFTFDPATGEWTETFNGEDYPTIDFEHFSFSHIINNNGYGGASWDGFTVSVSGDDANQSDFISNQWGNMAGGGIKTDANGKVIKDNGKVQVEKGIPYLVAYWSFYTDLTEDMPSLITPFDDMYEPVGMYVNASPWPYYGNLGHDNFARALDQEGDYFK
ncbi:MAG: hypothetical protein LBN18_02655, partial [Dysgonamonadaceae bacterium]|nr:hypothetical protein [Dysgonamonadaceae bacterium]